MLRSLIIEAIDGEFSPRREEQDADPNKGWIRGWLLSALGRICDGDTRARSVLENHLDAAHEPMPWARYWTLAGLATGKVTGLGELAQGLADKRDDLMLAQLAAAILASREDADADKYARQVIDGLSGWAKNTDLCWFTLRALRIAYVARATDLLRQLVITGTPDLCYEAIMALHLIPPGTPHAEAAARTLSEFVALHRRNPSWDGLRGPALTGLGLLAVRSSTSLLVEEISDENPAIVRAAAQALERLVGSQIATTRVVEAATQTGPDTSRRFADVLRWMGDRNLVVDQLESEMLSGPQEQQEVARALLSEVGGATAFRKLQARANAMAQYTEALKQADAEIRKLFEDSVREARGGFRLAVLMDALVFLVGLVLIVVSAVVALSSQRNLQDWIGAGVSGGAGVLGVLYGTLVAKPRRMVKEAVDHLMQLKITFLAYLRQLHQADQVYTRRLLDDEPIEAEELERFSHILRAIMQDAAAQIPVPPEKAQKRTHSE